MTGMNERETLQRLAKEVEGLRGRLNQIAGQLEQVDAVLAEHNVTEAVLKSLLQRPSSSSTAHVSIGSGVSLPYSPDAEEGTALVDLGSNVFGERPWSDALSITERRRVDIQDLRDELAAQSEQTERQLAAGAQAFNRLASSLESNAATSASTPAPLAEPPQVPVEEAPPPASPPAGRPRRRGMFGGELTLDD